MHTGHLHRRLIYQILLAVEKKIFCCRISKDKFRETVFTYCLNILYSMQFFVDHLNNSLSYSLNLLRKNIFHFVLFIVCKFS